MGEGVFLKSNKWNSTYGPKHPGPRRAPNSNRPVVRLTVESSLRRTATCNRTQHKRMPQYAIRILIWRAWFQEGQAKPNQGWRIHALTVLWCIFETGPRYERERSQRKHCMETAEKLCFSTVDTAVPLHLRRTAWIAPWSLRGAKRRARTHTIKNINAEAYCRSLAFLCRRPLAPTHHCALSVEDKKGEVTATV